MWRQHLLHTSKLPNWTPLDEWNVCAHTCFLSNIQYAPWNLHRVVIHVIVFSINTLRPRQNGRHFPDDIFKWIFLNENVWISINISLKFVPRGRINNMPTLVQEMAWHRPGDKPLSEPMMVRLPTHICVTRPQWVNHVSICHIGSSTFA